MAVTTTGFLLACIGAMLWLKVRKRGPRPPGLLPMLGSLEAGNVLDPTDRVGEVSVPKGENPFVSTGDTMEASIEGIAKGLDASSHARHDSAAL